MENGIRSFWKSVDAYIEKKTTKSSKSIQIRIFYYRKSYSKLCVFTYILKI